MYTKSSYPEEEEEEEEEEEQQQFTNFKDRGFALAVKNSRRNSGTFWEFIRFLENGRENTCSRSEVKVDHFLSICSVVSEVQLGFRISRLFMRRKSSFLPEALLVLPSTLVL